MPKSRPAATPAASKKAPAKKPAAKPSATTKTKPAAAPKKDAAPSKKETIKPTKPVAKTAEAKTPEPKAPAKPAAAPKAPAPKPAATKPAEPAKSAAGAATPPRKGITVVTPKPAKKEEKQGLQIPRFGAPLLKVGAKPKPLIESGPGAARKQLHIDDGTQPKKTPFDKKTLERFRSMLVKKRAELIGDVSAMESQALTGSSGSLSHMPQHMAEQGTETFDQALSLDLAAADRKLIREIDDALKRIDEGTFGVCELTGKPIKLERLEELPWARYSIEAARELERRATMPQVP